MSLKLLLFLQVHRSLGRLYAAIKKSSVGCIYSAHLQNDTKIHVFKLLLGLQSMLGYETYRLYKEHQNLGPLKILGGFDLK